MGATLWWKGSDSYGSAGRQDNVQKVINQEARLTLGALGLESGLRPAQLENRLRHYALRLASLPS